MKNNREIIDNPYFFKWIFSPNDELNLYWEQYMKDNQDQVKFIMETKNKLKKLRLKNDKLSFKEQADLTFLIMQKLDHEDRKVKRISVIKSFMKYAAVAILFSGISSAVVWFQMKKTDLDVYAENMNTPVQIDEPTIIMSKGENIKLDKSESTVKYTEKGDVIVNEENVVTASSEVTDEPVVNQIVIPYGNRSKISLSDGTLVWLNAGSRLLYPSVFTDKFREVVLFGEAFFEVSKNEEKPFVVKTTSLSVRVLGTKFNISAYPDDMSIQTVLNEGSVAIKKNSAQLFEKEVILKPNQLNIFNKKTKESKVYNVDAAYYSIWKEGLLSFDDIDLSRIIKKVERYYNIKVVYADPLLGSMKITGKLDLNQELEEVFEYLSKVSLTKLEKINNYKYRIK